MMSNHDPRTPSDITDGILLILGMLIFAVAVSLAIYLGESRPRAPQDAHRRDSEGALMPNFMAPPGSVGIPGTGMSIVGF